jgi:6-phosphogluconolactonase
MPDITIEDNINELPSKIATGLYKRLKTAIMNNGFATWCLAGGSTPMKIYAEIASNGKNEVSWDKVNFIIGDERIVPENDPDSNWEAIYDTFLSKIDLDPERLFKPQYFLEPSEARKDYEDQLDELLDSASKLHIDELWLGVGEDGHTLSLFPEKDFRYSTSLVISVADSPKPPPNRISLSLLALQNVVHCEVISLGDGKAQSIKRVIDKDGSAPIYAAIETIEINGGAVELVLDKGAASLI